MEQSARVIRIAEKRTYMYGINTVARAGILACWAPRCGSSLRESVYGRSYERLVRFTALPMLTRDEVAVAGAATLGDMGELQSVRKIVYWIEL
jgi:hypothetical protein